VLRPGRNVLAIHGMNRRSSDSDFLITPELLATAADQISPLRIDESTLVRARVWLDGEWSALSEETFVVDSGIPLRITEIMYHPAASSLDGRFDADEFEFIEIRNVGAQPIDLVDIRLGGGVQFDFAESLVEVLAPGASLVVVENVTAFAERYGMAGILVAGQYTGKLGNAGDSLTLEGRLGEPILDFVYSDEWHPITDGGGSSLTVVDAFAARESWGDAASWVPSPSPGGTPGVDASGEPSERGGWQRPGDSSQDGAVNLTDAVLILRTLFVDGAASLPCDGGSIAVGGNRTLNDVDQSGAVDVNDPVLLLSYLFLRGAPPALGVECVRIPGCPDACGG
jgi:hypothetical protein